MLKWSVTFSGLARKKKAQRRRRTRWNVADTRFCLASDLLVLGDQKHQAAKAFGSWGTIEIIDGVLARPWYISNLPMCALSGSR